METAYRTRDFNITEGALKEAVKQVGFSTDAIRKHLKNRIPALLSKATIRSTFHAK
jgi:hypothetical protein